MEVWISSCFFCPAFYRLDLELAALPGSAGVQSIVHCCSLDGLNPNHVQIMDVAPVFFTSSSILLSAMFSQDEVK